VRGESVRPTVSIGVATSGAADTVDTVLERADHALYAAKAAGRNCVRATSSLSRGAAALTVVAR
jgi:PleD family two-component response regulator